MVLLIVVKTNHFPIIVLRLTKMIDRHNSLREYRTIYENYLNQKNAKQNEDKIKALMQKRIVEVQAEKGISNYRIYKALNLNPGNVNAFLKNGDTGKVGIDTARRMLAYVNQ